MTDDNGDIVFNTGRDTVKGRNLSRTHFAALCVQDDRAPYSFVTIEGSVVLSEDLEDVGRWATIIGGRYMGKSRAEHSALGTASRESFSSDSTEIGSCQRQTSQVDGFGSPVRQEVSLDDVFGSQTLMASESMSVRSIVFDCPNLRLLRPSTRTS